MSELLTASQVAEQLGIVKSTVLSRSRSLKLKTVRVGKTTAFTTEQVEAIENHRPKSGPKEDGTIVVVAVKNPLSDIDYFWERANALIERESHKDKENEDYF